jgi:hypothetical protein
MYGAYAARGYSGVMLMRLLGAVALSLGLHRFIRAREERPTLALALTGLALLALRAVLSERPWMVSMLAWLYTLHWVTRARSSEPPRLAPLVLVFWLWANAHIQVVEGLALLGLAAVAPWLDRALGLTAQVDREASRRSALALGLGSLVTLLTPNGLDLVRVTREIGAQAGVFNLIADLASPSFRKPWDLAWALLAAGGFWALGRRRPSSLEALLLTGGFLMGLRSVRDAWFCALPAIWLLSEARLPWPQRAPALPDLAWRLLATLEVALGLGMVLLLGAYLSQMDEAYQVRRIAQQYPTAAVAEVRRQGLRGPLYNPFDWGGYLIWALPEQRVSVDGRTNLYGAERLAHNFDTWDGRDRDPALERANLVIGPAHDPLSEQLRAQPGQWELAYGDEVAEVFVRR